MKTMAWGAAGAFLLASNVLAVQVGLEPTKAAKPDVLAAKMEQMRDDYRELQAKCWGKGHYLRDPDGLVWYLSDAPNAASCNKAEELKDDYRAAYKELLKLDRRRVLFDNVPKYIDRP